MARPADYRRRNPATLQKEIDLPEHCQWISNTLSGKLLLAAAHLDIIRNLRVCRRRAVQGNVVQLGGKKRKTESAENSLPPYAPTFPAVRPAGVQYYSTVCSVQSTVCSVQCAVCSLQGAGFSVQCAVCSVQCAVCSVQRRCPYGRALPPPGTDQSNDWIGINSRPWRQFHRFPPLVKIAGKLFYSRIWAGHKTFY
jgi:hypothetical protein